MKQQLQQRLQTLQTEFRRGQETLATLENQQIAVKETLLRITGAMQVLEELIAQADQPRDWQANTHPKEIFHECA